MATAIGYPLRVEGSLGTGLSRWLWLVKWLLAIPHYLMLAFLWIGFVVTSVIAFFAILLTGHYPRTLFDFNVGVLRWTWRVSYYAYGALGTDRYPPFTLHDVPDYPARLEVAYPQHLSRGLVLVKWWLLALPHYLVVGLFLGGGTWFVSQSDHTVGLASGGLIGLLVLVAGVVLLVTGAYPKSIFDLVLGLDRWVLRVAAYSGLMTDRYPPFRLDMGGNDPGTLAFTDATPPSASPTPTSDHHRHLTAGRIVALTAGSLLTLISIGLLVGGGSGLVVDQARRDASGYVRTDSQQLTTDAAALSSRDARLQVDGPAAGIVDLVLGDTEVRVTSTSGTGVFIGIAERGDADAYLSGFSSADVIGIGGADPTYVTTGTGTPATAPSEAGIWAESVAGTGTQTLRWEPGEGDWVLVVMNVDGTPGIDITADVGARLPALTEVSVALLTTGGLLLVASAVIIGLAVRRR